MPGRQNRVTPCREAYKEVCNEPKDGDVQLIIGCDLHTRYQVIAMLDTETGEMVTHRLEHENGEATAFYRRLPKPALIGIEATGYTQWFERMVTWLGHELWAGDPAEIRAPAVRKQKTDTRDAEHRSPDL